MKAIGPKSIASFLAALLHVVRVVLWIAFAGLSIAVVVVPFVPFIVEWAANSEGFQIDGDMDVDAEDILDIFFHFVTFGVMLFVVDRLLELLKTLRQGTSFVKENALRFRRIGFALMIGEGSKIVFGILSAIFDADLELGVEFMAIIAIAAVFVLSEVFLEGARMKEEQDLTV